jgi:hypothetical protein
MRPIQPPSVSVFRFEMPTTQAEAADWYLRPRQENLPLMHYMSADFFCSILESDSLHMSRSVRSEMDTEDALLPVDGRNTPTVLEPLGDHPGSTIDHSIRDHEHNAFDRPYTYQHCWTCSIREDVWMWTVYGQAAQGVCILSDSWSLASAIYLDSKLELDVVGTPYWKHGQDIPRLLPSVGSAVKRADGFEAEKEVRVTATVCPKHRPTEPDPFILLRIDPAKMIRGLILGPHISNENKETVQKALSLRCPELNPIESSLVIH